MKKVLFIVAALFVCTSFSFAADLESESFDVYSLSPLSSSLLDYSVMPLADASWSTTDSQNLADIRNALVRTTSGSILDYLYDIQDRLFYIKQSTDYMPTMSSHLDHIQQILGYGDSVSAYPSIYSLLYRVRDLINDSNSSLDLIYTDTVSIDSTLSAFFGRFYNQDWILRVITSYQNGQVDGYDIVADFSNFFPQWFINSSFDAVNPWSGERTLYSFVKQLKDVLASDDDLALANSQKQNREEIEDSFLNGSSGSTSLGSSDFADLSDVGGTVNDTLSLNGQASISSFTSGLSGADLEGQNWFSAATRDSLDSVSSSISTFALDDPYNMEGWEEQYSWVLGGE